MQMIAQIDECLAKSDLHFVQFLSILKRICFDFFVEKSQDDTLQPDSVQTIV